MKKFYVDLDVTFSRRMYVYAKDEETARVKAMAIAEDDTYSFARKYTHVSTEITDIFETE